MEQEEIIDFALKQYKDNKLTDYYVILNSRPIYLGHIYFNHSEPKHQQLRGRKVRIVEDNMIEMLNPEKIDSRIFWKKAVDLFPLFTICGGPCANKDEVNKETFFGVHKKTNALDWLSQSLNNESTILEIGPGYGNVRKFIENDYPNVKYYGLDVNPLFECETLFKGDGRNIPTEIPYNLDVVYSINVFQHLSQEQRNSYYQQVYDRLKIGGKFIVSSFCKTKKNYKKFGWADKNGEYYTIFLGQFTLVEKYYSWKKNIEKIGFKIIDKNEWNNSVTLYLEKI